MDHHNHGDHDMSSTTLGHVHPTDAPDGGHGDHGDHGGGHEMMMMYFHTTIGNDYVLFKCWKPQTAGG